SRASSIRCLRLLTAPDKLVTLDELATVLWGASPPLSAELTLRSRVSRLRTVLAPATTNEPAGGAGNVLHGHDGGYLIHLESAELA
ncbi:MAG TPA: helix-turn-helix domain-containing protein, partial [Thermomonospora sp.]|nr:helix-turn-helix domain-containing protein [Thermomonospora sp.]